MNKFLKSYTLILIIGGLVGLLASFTLVTDKIKVLENPAVELPCSINPFISCTSVMDAWQNEVFGFPNALLGMLFFAGVIIVGLLFLYKNKINKGFANLFLTGNIASIVFVHWFIYQSVYKIGSLCIYCIIIWIVTWPIFLYTTIWNLNENHFSLHKIHPNLDKFIQKNHLYLLVTWYIIIACLIFIQFKDFFLY